MTDCYLAGGADGTMQNIVNNRGTGVMQLVKSCIFNAEYGLMGSFDNEGVIYTISKCVFIGNEGGFNILSGGNEINSISSCMFNKTLMVDMIKIFTNNIGAGSTEIEMGQSSGVMITDNAGFKLDLNESTNTIISNNILSSLYLGDCVQCNIVGNNISGGLTLYTCGGNIISTNAVNGTGLYNGFRVLGNSDLNQITNNNLAQAISVSGGTGNSIYGNKYDETDDMPWD